MKNTLTLITLLTLFSCIKDHDQTPSQGLFSEYQARFNALAEQYGVAYSDALIVESELENKEHLALCDMQTNTVYIDINRWVNSSDALREIVIFHELGHCSLNKQHRDDSPGLLNSDFSLYSVRDYSDNRRQFLDNLFLDTPITLKTTVYTTKNSSKSAKYLILHASPFCPHFTEGEL